MEPEVYDIDGKDQLDGSSLRKSWRVEIGESIHDSKFETDFSGFTCYFTFGDFADCLHHESLLTLGLVIN